jgi:hypothetical protein
MMTVISNKIVLRVLSKHIDSQFDPCIIIQSDNSGSARKICRKIMEAFGPENILICEYEQCTNLHQELIDEYK